MKETITIKSITYPQKTSKAGKTYYGCEIISEESDKLYEGFKSEIPSNWAVGSVVEIEVTEKQYPNKTYYNFKPVGEPITPQQYLNKETGTDTNTRLIFLEDAVKQLDARVKVLEPKKESEFDYGESIEPDF